MVSFRLTSNTPLEHFLPWIFQTLIKIITDRIDSIWYLGANYWELSLIAYQFITNATKFGKVDSRYGQIWISCMWNLSLVRPRCEKCVCGWIGTILRRVSSRGCLWIKLICEVSNLTRLHIVLNANFSFILVGNISLLSLQRFFIFNTRLITNHLTQHVRLLRIFTFVTPKAATLPFMHQSCRQGL